MADAPSPSEPAPPGEPPPGVTSEVLWRLAARLFIDHRPAPAAEEAYCENCRHSWPCSGRRLAELGLNRATA
jgi:hypothetical protein